MKLRAVRGMNDILPEEIASFRRLESAFRRTAELFGFAEVRTPLIEDTALFVQEMGETSDVVEKEMYSFERHGDRLTVRPEGTAGAARAFVEHNVSQREPVTKWYYHGPMFRGERPAKGRYRQFYQAGVECFGDPGPAADVEVISLAIEILRSLGVGGLVVHVNSLGSAGTRAAYRDALVAYFEPLRAQLSEESQRRLEKNPLRILDSKSAADQKLCEGAPSIHDVLSDEDRAHFDGVKKGLEALGITAVVDQKLVRGLDYYTRTLFEIKATEADLGAQDTLCGGGRYDHMVENLGGPKVPAIGFGMGMERVLIAMKQAEKIPEASGAFVAALSPQAAAPGLKLAQELRALGIATELDARDARLKAMIRRAEGLGKAFLLVLGDDELARGEVAIKDLTARTQDAVPLPRAAEAVRARIASKNSPSNEVRV